MTDPADGRPVEELAARVLAADPAAADEGAGEGAGADAAALAALVPAAAPWWGTGPRGLMWSPGPVPAARVR